MSDIRVTGAEDFLTLSKRLKAEGKTEFRKELNKNLRAGAKPLIGKTRAAFRAGLPQRGGLAAAIGRRPMRVKVATGKTPGVSIVASKTDPRIDQGRIAHPVFNRRHADGRRVMVVQRVTPGLFSDTLEREAPAVREDLVVAIETMQRRVYGRG